MGARSQASARGTAMGCLTTLPQPEGRIETANVGLARRVPGKPFSLASELRTMTRILSPKGWGIASPSYWRTTLPSWWRTLSRWRMTLPR